MIRLPPRSTRTDTRFPSRRSSDLLDHADLVVDRHDGDERRPFGQRRAHGLGIDQTAAVDRQPRHLEALAFEPSAAFEHAFVLGRSEEHTSELQSLMRISYAVFCLKKKKNN